MSLISVAAIASMFLRAIGRWLHMPRISGLLGTLGCLATCWCLGGGVAAAGQARSSSAPSATTNDDATLHLDALTIPPSDFMSPELRVATAEGYANFRKNPSLSKDKTPQRDAPKSEWDQFREGEKKSLSSLVAKVRALYPVDVVDTHIAGVHVGIVTPRNGVSTANAHRVLINLHGGGFVEFSGLSNPLMEAIPISALGRFKVVTVDYRQSPEFEYPAATEDVVAVYKALLKQYSPMSVGLYGCSAGGVLVGQSVSWLLNEHLPRPGAIGIFSVGLLSSATLKRGDAWMWQGGIIPENPAFRGFTPPDGWFWYLSSAKPNDPKAFPETSEATLRKFPPTLFVAGTREFGMDWALTSHAKLLKLEAPSSLYLIESAGHCLPVFAPEIPEAQDTNAYIARWFEQHLKQ